MVYISNHEKLNFDKFKILSDMLKNKLFCVSLILALGLFCVISESKVIVTEIMYDPIGNDNNHEWVEIYNDGEEETEIVGGESDGSWRFNDGNNHKLNESEFTDYMLIYPEEYLILADNPTTFLQDFSDYEGTVIDTIMSLSNNGDTIKLSNNEGKDFFETVTYTPDIGGKNNGNSLQLINNKWIECAPSPGLGNDCSISEDTTTISIVKEETSTTMITTTILEPDSNRCDFKISVNADKHSFDLTEKIKYKIRLENLDCNKKKNKIEIEHWIEDQNGNLIKNRDNSTVEIACQSSKTFQWTPKISGIFVIKSKITDISCLDFNEKNNEDNENITIQKKMEVGDYESIIKISKIKTENRIKFGELFILDIDIFRGNTSESLVNFWVQDHDGNKISDVYSLHISSKMKHYRFSVPLYLLPNCDGKYKYGKYDITGKGLGLNISKEIEINENSDVACRTIVKESIKESLKTENITQKSVEKLKNVGHFIKIRDKLINFFKKILS
ncbi:MAG: lamin tail domain-containing protein [Candidatus Aenigmarchaeota archaeon]|nr:lamin tail domain-containing protein [Candidatus Aenigmarchaeota archaeon]